MKRIEVDDPKSILEKNFNFRIPGEIVFILPSFFCIRHMYLDGAINDEDGHLDTNIFVLTVYVRKSSLNVVLKKLLYLFQYRFVISV